MAKPRGRKLNGWLILDKPQGLISNQSLNRVKRFFNPQKAGMAGILDPLATGILPIAFGEATKTVAHVVDSSKSYRFTVRWGVATDTDDADGQPIKTSEERPTREAIEATLPDFTGEIMQTPPRYSAIKVQGERAYDLARDGEVFELQERPVNVMSLRVVETPDADTCVFEADCGKGTYVRSIARDMGEALGCLGHIAALRRTRVGAFQEDASITLDQIEAAVAEGDTLLDRFISPVEAALDGIPHLSVSRNDAQTLRRGHAILLRGQSAPVLSGSIYALSDGVLVAIGEVEKGEMHPLRVFNI
ncbi:MAG: tRNA pseudouridine(55) synthase TruB [Hyphomicrobiales bacterium]|nr:tRNA pseudouridine(55) synthase TruB [Hyphomicrobiales bacterium]